MREKLSLWCLEEQESRSQGASKQETETLSAHVQLAGAGNPISPTFTITMVTWVRWVLVA